ncbi:MAG: DUF1573 domain-containing protein [Bacteroidales bacterium]
MYKIRAFFFLLFIAGVFLSCGRDHSDASGAGLKSQADGKGDPKIDFRTRRYDFGKVKNGEQLAYTFIYKNTGDVPLVIHSARADCGCTVAEYDSEPLAPGSEGKIKVIFNTRGFHGQQTKALHLSTNAEEGFVTLALRAMVE